MASKSSIRYAKGNGRTRRYHCLDCRARVFYGDRCPDCERDLRQRQDLRRRRKR
jgi:hypothetical protein